MLPLFFKCRMLLLQYNFLFCQLCREKQFFESDDVLRTIDDRWLGIPSLCRHLVQVQYEKLQDTLPVLLKEVSRVFFLGIGCYSAWI